MDDADATCLVFVHINGKPMYGKPLYPDSVVFMRRFGLFFGTVLQDLYKSPIHNTHVCVYGILERGTSGLGEGQK